MRCDEVLCRIDDYVDGGLHRDERDSVARHLLGCPACREEERALRALVAGAAALPRELSPARELWPGIAERLRPTLLAFPRRMPSFRPLSLLAAAVLIALSSALTWRIARRQDAPLTLRAGAPAQGTLIAHTPAAGLLEAETEYARATSELLQALEDRRESLAPETLVAVEQNMRAIDDALKSLREALQSDPGNQELTQLLAGTHRRKVEALRRVVRLSRI